ncbi:hypothetical protein [Streptomyces sp. NPDC058486]|uniref:hypothetical protein n=1 Tax=unclassified Streptomyces TaxID=2593676 RepID=UPI003662B52B
MDALQQHLFDSYRAARLGEPAPPAPATWPCCGSSATTAASSGWWPAAPPPAASVRP